MIQERAAMATLSDILVGRVGNLSWLRGLILAVGASGLLALSAKIQIPFWPVPQTMQTFLVLVLAMALGRWIGLAAVCLYMLEGALGLPVFANSPERGVGLAYMTGPTGGYLLGFVLATILLGNLARRGWDRSPLTMAAAMATGMLAIYLPGIAWLSAIIGFNKAVLHGLQPFLLGDVAKLLLAAGLMPLIWNLIGRAKSSSH